MATSKKKLDLAGWQAQIKKHQERRDGIMKKGLSDIEKMKYQNSVNLKRSKSGRDARISKAMKKLNKDK